MNRLLSANFARLWRSKIFYGLGLFMIGYSVMFYRDVYMTIHVKHKEYTNWNFAFFGGLLPIGIALAVFVSFYIGTEYSSGTIRNKITRRSFALSYLYGESACLLCGGGYHDDGLLLNISDDGGYSRG